MSLLTGLKLTIQLINKAIDLKIKIINIISSYTDIKYFDQKIWTSRKKHQSMFKYIILIILNLNQMIISEKLK